MCHLTRHCLLPNTPQQEEQQQQLVGNSNSNRRSAHTPIVGYNHYSSMVNVSLAASGAASQYYHHAPWLHQADFARRTAPGVVGLEWHSTDMATACRHPTGLITTARDDASVWLSCGTYIAHGRLNRNDFDIVMGVTIQQTNHEALQQANQWYWTHVWNQTVRDDALGLDGMDPVQFSMEPFRSIGDGDHVRLRVRDTNGNDEYNDETDQDDDYDELWFGIQSWVDDLSPNDLGVNEHNNFNQPDDAHVDRVAGIVRFRADTLDCVGVIWRETQTRVPWVAFDEVRQLAFTIDASLDPLHPTVEDDNEDEDESWDEQQELVVDDPHQSPMEWHTSSPPRPALAVFDAMTMEWKESHRIVNLPTELYSTTITTIQDAHSKDDEPEDTGGTNYAYNTDEDAADPTVVTTTTISNAWEWMHLFRGAAVDNSIRHVKNRKRHKSGILYISVNDERSTLLALEFDDHYSGPDTAAEYQDEQAYDPTAPVAVVVDIWHTGLGNPRTGVALTHHQILSLSQRRHFQSSWSQQQQPQPPPEGGEGDSIPGDSEFYAHIVALEFPSILKDEEIQFGWGVLTGLVIAISLHFLLWSWRKWAFCCCCRIVHRPLDSVVSSQLPRNTTAMSSSSQHSAATAAMGSGVRYHTVALTDSSGVGAPARAQQSASQDAAPPALPPAPAPLSPTPAPSTSTMGLVARSVSSPATVLAAGNENPESPIIVQQQQQQPPQQSSSSSWYPFLSSKKPPSFLENKHGRRYQRRTIHGNNEYRLAPPPAQPRSSFFFPFTSSRSKATTLDIA